MKWLTFTRRNGRQLLAVVFVFLACRVSPQTANAGLPSTLSSAEIVRRMQEHDRAQMAALAHYHALRHYAVEYQGFFRRITATMDVEVNYAASSGKSFRIVSQNGSGVLCQKVLKRAVDSEKEASLNRGATALTHTNYRFRLIGSESLNGRPAYILDVKPVTPNKFLYRGKIWVDAVDFAVAKMEVQPAKNPSFWTSKTVIHHTNVDIGGFWLPKQNRSETKVRIGGTAVLTIDYGTYQIVPQQLRPVVTPLR
jgi:hypothetical protein